IWRQGFRADHSRARRALRSHRRPSLRRSWDPGLPFAFPWLKDPTMGTRRRISVLGSPGSIGRSTLDVVARCSDRFEVVALAAGRNIELLLEHIRAFRPRVVAVATEEGARAVADALGRKGPEILVGEAGACAVAALDEAD